MEYDKYFKEVPTLQLHTPKPNDKFQAYLRLKTEEWVPVNSKVNYDGSFLEFESETYVAGGASGGPIINSEGEVVSIVSNSDEGDQTGPYIGRGPIPELCLPERILKEFF